MTRGGGQPRLHHRFLWGMWFQRDRVNCGVIGAGGDTGMQQHSSAGSHDGLCSAGGDPQIFVWLHSAGM